MKISAQDFDTAARTVYGEARGEPFAGMKAVAHVMLNRARKMYRGKNLHEVCTAKWQFSCWNEDDPNREKLLAVDYSDTRFTKSVRALLEAIEEQVISYDPTKASLHYHVRNMSNPPNWAKGHKPAAIIGAHAFFNTVK